MRTRMKIMGLAALPLAGLLATGGAALAQTAGTPTGTQVVQQAVTHRAGDPCPAHAAQTATQRSADQCPQHAVKVAVQPAGQHQQTRDRDRDCGTCGDHQAPAVQTAARTMEHARDGSCAQHADR